MPTAIPKKSPLTTSIRSLCSVLERQLKQQKLSAWEPVLTIQSVLTLLVGITVVFTPVGIILLHTSNLVDEITVKYSNGECKMTNENDRETFLDCDGYLQKHLGRECSCEVSFELDHAFRGQVYVYYGLTNFYQNHRRYVRSYDPRQLSGWNDLTFNSLTHRCEPYRGIERSSLVYAPCGAIANSFFNDSLVIRYHGVNVSTPLKLLRTDIAWTTDKQHMYKNPTGEHFNYVDPMNCSTLSKGECSMFDWKNTIPPPNWNRHISKLSNANSTGYENEALMVWMRTAAFPNFKKFYGRVNHDDGIFKAGLPAGLYTLHVKYAYSVASFGGSKSLILTTTTWMGGKNPFLVAAYITVGIISCLLAILFGFVHHRYGGRIRENNLNEQTAYFDVS